MRETTIYSSTFALCLVLCATVAVLAHGRKKHMGTDLEVLLKEKASITIDFPASNFYWKEEDIKGTPEEGSIATVKVKGIYYFIHWFPREVEEITPEFVRERIPKLWPSEGLVVKDIKPMTVAGHPAYFATAEPKRKFYCPNFLVWNCPESGRTFIADMNYSIAWLTPTSYLDAMINTTSKTLACHPGAPTSKINGHAVRYDNPSFGISFRHPVSWFVFENPYAINSPAYEGIRDEKIGSVLAWLQDEQVVIRFIWRPMPEPNEQGEQTATMGGPREKLAAAENVMKAIEGIESFTPQAYETLKVGEREIHKVIGAIVKEKPKQEAGKFVPNARAVSMLIDNEENYRRLIVVIQINYYNIDGIAYPPKRYLLDSLSHKIAKMIEFLCFQKVIVLENKP